MNDARFRYHAFISYSQDPDKDLAIEIKNRLEKFGLGWHRLKRQQLFIFRDATDLSLTRDLGGKIKEGLEQSEFLIVLAQKKLSLTVQNWVNQEIEYFIEVCNLRKVDPTDYIILVVTNGEIDWDRASNTWNFEKTNVLPPVLKNAFISQPLYVDVRILRSPISAKIKNITLNNALIVLAAKLLKKKPGDLQNRVIQFQRIIIGIVATVAAVMLGLSVFSVIQRNAATKEKNNANLAKTEAINQKVLADTSRNQALRAKAESEKQRSKADLSKIKADSARNEAVFQKIIADTNRIRAVKAKYIAEDAKREAENKRFEAETAKRQTDTLNKLLIAENLSITYGNLLSKGPPKKNTEMEISYTDSVIKATLQFNKYFVKTKINHYNKIESIYTAVQEAYKKNLNTEIILPKKYSRLFVTENQELYLLNGNGDIHSLNFVSKALDTSFTATYNKGAYEITPVWGSEYVLFSFQNNNWNIMDLGKRTIIPVRNKNINSQSLINNAQLEKQDQSIIAVNKKGYILYLVPTTNRELEVQKAIPTTQVIVSISKGPEGSFLLVQNGDFIAQSVCNGCFEPFFTKVASFTANQGDNKIYLGFIDGTVSSFDLKNNTTSVINKLENRINRIIWAEMHNTLIIQEGINKILLYQFINGQYVRLFSSYFGEDINDLCLDNNGRLFILFDKNHLEWWNIDQHKMISDIEELKKTFVQK
jgi:hypothetical protein